MLHVVPSVMNIEWLADGRHLVFTVPDDKGRPWQVREARSLHMSRISPVAGAAAVSEGSCETWFRVWTSMPRCALPANCCSVPAVWLQEDVHAWV